ncbi:transposase [Brevibacterium sp. PAMC21349]|nr:transposase [Brevibacterium sp. PAMC21349]
MGNQKPDVSGLINNAKEKKEKTLKKVEQSIKQMIKTQQKINFNSVSTHAGVSKTYLYKSPNLKERIEYLRSQQEGILSIKQVKRNVSEESKDVIIASLRKRVKELEKECQELKDKVKINYGKIYNKI